MRSLARGLLRRAGLQRMHHPSFVDLMKNRGIRTVLDVGANDGGFGTEIRQRGYTGRIVSFEPIAAIFESLKERTRNDPAWTVHNIGLGAEDGEATITVSKSDVFSSFLKPTAYSAALWDGIGADREERVTVRRLDSFLREHPDLLDRPYLKLDVQGLELPVLRGTGDHLDTMVLVQAELALRTLYEGQESWSDIIAWMKARGFDVVLVKENGVDWETVRSVELDFVFEKLPA